MYTSMPLFASATYGKSKSFICHLLFVACGRSPHLWEFAMSVVIGTAVLERNEGEIDLVEFNMSDEFMECSLPERIGALHMLIDHLYDLMDDDYIIVEVEDAEDDGEEGEVEEYAEDEYEEEDETLV
jgi:hypothetical protein